jgi:pyruvate kinase
MLEKLLAAGMDVARLNFSHGSHEQHREVIERIRAASLKVRKGVGILQDLQGPKIRTGKVRDNGIELIEGREIEITTHEAVVGTPELISTTYEHLCADVNVGDGILLDDGLLELKVLSTDKKERCRCVIVHGGLLKNNKGINLPGVALRAEAMSPKDKEDLLFGIKHGVDYVGLSFVRSPQDLDQCRAVMAQGGRTVPIISKLEKPEAIARLDAILDKSDGVMVARGDLGVEIPPEEVPAIQKDIIRRANQRALPVIVATQMLNSMIEHPRPTRAEASDVANAIFDGADAVMLSAETASGAYPIEAVEMMDRIAASVEADPLYQSIIESQRPPPEPTTPDAITAAVHEVTRTIQARAIVCWTGSGSTALRAARERAEAPIIVLTPSLQTARRMAIVWGLYPVHTEDAHDMDDVVDRASEIARKEGFAEAGERVVIIAGVPLGTPGATNMLRVAFVGKK